MANIKNLFIGPGAIGEYTNCVLPRNIYFNGVKVKNFYADLQLVWKNSDYFKFITSSTPSEQYEPNTIIFENFGSVFNGEYRTVESAAEIDLTEMGQIYVIQEVTDENN